MTKEQEVFGKFTIKIVKTRNDGHLVLRGVQVQKDEVNISKHDCCMLFSILDGV